MRTSKLSTPQYAKKYSSGLGQRKLYATVACAAQDATFGGVFILAKPHCVLCKRSNSHHALRSPVKAERQAKPAGDKETRHRHLQSQLPLPRLS